MADPSYMPQRGGIDQRSQSSTLQLTPLGGRIVRDLPGNSVKLSKTYNSPFWVSSAAGEIRRGFI